MRRWLGGLGLVFALTFAALPASAQDDAEAPDEARAAQFVGVEGSVAEDIPGGPLLVAAYGVAWLFLFLYLVRLGRLNAQAAAELSDLEKRLQA